MKILIIDDEPVNMILLEEMLTDGGYTRFKSVQDSRTAIATCESYVPDLVLLDLMMPHVDGLTILQSLRSAATEIFLPVIVLTADSSVETKRRVLRAGATDFLLKPFDQLEVLLRISNLLEMRRLHLLMDNQRAAFEEALRDRSLELREAKTSTQSDAA